MSNPQSLTTCITPGSVTVTIKYNVHVIAMATPIRPVEPKLKKKLKVLHKYIITIGLEPGNI